MRKRNRWLTFVVALLLVALLASCSEDPINDPQEENKENKEEVADELIELSWITDSGAIGFYNNLRDSHYQQDQLAYYDFSSLTYEVIELPEKIRGTHGIQIHRSYLFGDVAIGFTTRVEEQSGLNHVLDDSVANTIFLWNTKTGSLRKITVDENYFFYSHKLFCKEDDDNHLWFLGCYREEKEVLLLEVDLRDGSVVNMGSYVHEVDYSFLKNTDGYQFSQFLQGETGEYYGFRTEEKDGVLIQSLFELSDDNAPICVVEDLYPAEIGSVIDNTYKQINGKLYYIGVDRVNRKTYVMRADLITGEVEYRESSAEEQNRCVFSKYQNDLILVSKLSVETTGVLRPDSVVLSREDSYMSETPQFFSFKQTEKEEKDIINDDLASAVEENERENSVEQNSALIEENEKLWDVDLSDFETDASVIAETLWYRACAFYDIESPLTGYGNGKTAPNGLHYLRFKSDYNTLADITFTENGLAELESSVCLGADRIFTDEDGTHFRVEAMATIYSFRNNFKWANILSENSGSYVFEIGYGGKPSYDDLTPKSLDELPTEQVKMEVAYVNGRWLVSHIEYPNGIG